MTNISNRPGVADYAAFARAIYETGVLSDPWLDGCKRFEMEGVVLAPSTAERLNQAAERVAYLHQELVQILMKNPALQTDFYHLTPYQQVMWEAAGGLWHGMARADLFICEDGSIACCELNSDTPSGQPEAVILNRLLRDSHNQKSIVDDPNELMEIRYVRMLKESHAKNTSEPLKTVGIIYPTELTEDLAMVTLFTRWLEEEGIKVVHGSPFNLRRKIGGIEVLGRQVDLLIRHYKTDWWGERIPVWDDAPAYPDPEPLSHQLQALLSAEMNGEVSVVNPFGCVITQNKLSLAFFWEKQELFSRRAQKWIRKYIPETYRMTTIGLEQLKAEQEGWVLKSDYGCEGQETICGPFVSQEVWLKSLEHARPQHFVAQRFFQAQADRLGRLVNYGVYLLGGSANGYFTRLSKQSTGYSAVTAPTFIAR